MQILIVDVFLSDVLVPSNPKCVMCDDQDPWGPGEPHNVRVKMLKPGGIGDEPFIVKGTLVIFPIKDDVCKFLLQSSATLRKITPYKNY